MAIYHLHLQVIGRSAGRTAVAAAAYRSGSKMECRYTGETIDYRRKEWIEYSTIMLPPTAPLAYKFRETLWNAVEEAEKARDAQLAWEIDAALPAELSLEQQIALIREYAAREIVATGAIADISIHNPPVCDDKNRPLDINGNITGEIDEMTFRNPHVHIMVPIRPLDENGHWAAKTQKEYLCVFPGGDGKERALTASELKLPENSGWEKQFKYRVGRASKWMAESEGEALGLEKASREPKSTRYGRKNAFTADWGRKEKVLQLRAVWEEVVNSHLMAAGISARIDCRSYRDQGIDKVPQIHVGSAALNMDKRAQRFAKQAGSQPPALSDRAGILAEINRINAEYVRAKNSRTGRAVSVGALYGSALEIRHCLNQFSVERKAIETALSESREFVAYVRSLQEKIKAADALSEERIHLLEAELDGLSFFQSGRREELMGKIQDEKASINNRKEYFVNVLASAGMKSEADLLKKEHEISKLEQDASKLDHKTERLQKDLDDTVARINKEANGRGMTLDDVHAEYEEWSSGETSEEEAFQEDAEERTDREEQETKEKSYGDVVYLTAGPDIDGMLELGVSAVDLMVRASTTAIDKIRQEERKNRRRR